MSDVQKYEVEYSESFAESLRLSKATIAISTYQLGKVIFLTHSPKVGVKQLPVSFKRPMGITFFEGKMAVACKGEIQVFAEEKRFPKELDPNGTVEGVYFPRASYYTGDLDLHDIGFGRGGLWAVNTRFSCLSTFGADFNFIPRWKPEWISKLVPEDRCHLNGMAMKGDRPAFATALSRTDIKDGWRDNITDTGVLIEIPSGKVVCEGLAMPHSPRLIGEYVYLLQSAKGLLTRIDTSNGRAEDVADLKCFCRGLSQAGQYLFIGVSKPRRSSKTFAKLPIDDFSDRAGVLVYDMVSQTLAGELWYSGKVEEIYDVQVVPGQGLPGVILPSDDRHRSVIHSNGVMFNRQ